MWSTCYFLTHQQLSAIVVEGQRPCCMCNSTVRAIFFMFNSKNSFLIVKSILSKIVWAIILKLPSVNLEVNLPWVDLEIKFPSLFWFRPLDQNYLSLKIQFVEFCKIRSFWCKVKIFRRFICILIRELILLVRRWLLKKFRWSLLKFQKLS